MPTFIGYNTINQYGDQTLTDFALIKRDLLNAFNIRQGEMPGRPLVGTKMWDYVFDAQTPETSQLIREEVNRMVGQDPRVFVNSTNIFTQENGLLIELAVETVGNSTAETLSLFFDQTARSAQYV